MAATRAGAPAPDALEVLAGASLYGAVLTDWLRPLPGEQLAGHLEPITFALLGYYFSRAPSLRNETTPREEVGRQTQKADASQHAKEQ